MKSHNYFLDAAQVQKLRASCEIASPKGKRDIAILDAMLFQGLRLKEVAELRLENFSNLKDQLRLKLKDRSESIEIHEKFHHSLNSWLSQRDISQMNADGPVFVPISKSYWNTQKPLSGQTISRLVAKYGNLAGLTPLRGPERLKPGDLRRTCARTAYDHGAKLVSIKAFLGFNHLETAARYIGVMNGIDADLVRDYIRYEDL